MLDLGGVQNGVHVQLQRASVDLDGQLLGRQALVERRVSKLPPSVDRVGEAKRGHCLRNIAPELPGQLISRARRALDRQKCQEPLCLPASQLDLVAGATDAHAAEHGDRKQGADSWFAAHVGDYRVTHQYHSRNDFCRLERAGYSKGMPPVCRALPPVSAIATSNRGVTMSEGNGCNAGATARTTCISFCGLVDRPRQPRRRLASASERSRVVEIDRSARHRPGAPSGCRSSQLLASSSVALARHCRSATVRLASPSRRVLPAPGGSLAPSDRAPARQRAPPPSGSCVMPTRRQARVHCRSTTARR